MLSFLKFISIIGLCIIISACATIRPEPCIKNGKVYGVTKGLFRGKFWNYYDAALSYTDGACWQEAEQAFKQAIQLKSTDEQWTMTYGLRFINYFPHRELGIVYLFQGKFKQAIQELERSIQQQQSGRGMFYLNSARKCQALTQNNDRLKPQIVIESPEKKMIVPVIMQ
jgi:tetratricopeptide (TPR) repeat protein